MPFNINRGLTLSETTWQVVLLGHGSLLFPYRPVLLRHGEIHKELGGFHTSSHGPFCAL